MAQSGRGKIVPLAAGWGVLLLVSGHSPRAHAGPERIQFIYSAPASCPNQEAFEREVHNRTRAVFQSAGRASQRSFRISIRLQNKQFAGNVAEENAPRPSSAQDIAGEQCGDVVTALAVRTALAIDGGAAPPMPPLLPSFKSAPISPYLDSHAHAHPYVPATIPRLDTRAPRPPFRLSIGTQFAAVGAVSPGAAPAASFFIDGSRLGDGAEGFSVRLSILRAQNHVVVNQEIVSMEWIAGRVEGCPLHRRFGRITFVPCLSIDAGTLEWTANPPGSTRTWVASNLLARGQLAIIGPLVAEAQAGLVVPFTRDRFGFGPHEGSGKVVHKVPILGASAGAGLALRFP